MILKKDKTIIFNSLDKAINKLIEVENKLVEELVRTQSFIDSKPSSFRKTQSGKRYFERSVDLFNERAVIHERLLVLKLETIRLSMGINKSKDYAHYEQQNHGIIKIT